MVIEDLIFLGYQLAFSVIAMDHRLKVISLTPSFSFIQSASDGRDRASLYLAFTAASILQAHILQDIEKFVDNLPPEVMRVVFQQSPNYANTHPHLTTISVLIFKASFPTDNPTAFCTSQRRQTSNSSSSSLLDGTRSSCMIFVPNQVMRHRFLLLNNFLVGGVLSRWNISSLESQSLTRPYSLLTETVGQKSSSASWITFMWKALSTVTCGPRTSSAKKIP
jgi:hypothetical protein